MKKLLLFVGTILLTVPTMAGEIVTDSVKSNILGTDVKFNVYLPEDYDQENALYPVIYLLHGLWGDYTDWEALGRMDLVADELMESGESVKAVIVMPNAGGHDSNKVWSGYFNMPGWSYEDFFFKEFMPAVESKYRCISDKGHRAIMGLSMGGGGSTVYCQHHPDKFSSCYAMSAWLSEEEPKVESEDQKGKLYYTDLSVAQNSALKFMDQADEETIAKLRTVKWYFDCGDDDDLLELSFLMHKKMMNADVDDQLTVRNGSHNWEYWHTALRVALPFASRNFF